MNCITCGAPMGSGTLLCEFCGTAQKTISDPADEVKAVIELSQVWAKLGEQDATTKGLAHSVGAGSPQAIAIKTRKFWSTAYMPSTAEGLVAAAEQSAMLITKANFGDAIAPAVNAAMLGRMENCLDMLAIKAPGDPRLAALQAMYAKKKEANTGLKKMGLCFPADTRFLTPSGYREIGTLERGDEVLSIRSTGEVVRELVSRKVSYGNSPILSVEMEGRTLRTTAHHSLRTAEGWKRAGTLREGDTLHCLDDRGIVVEAEVLTLVQHPAEAVFNLHTTGPHTAVVEGVVTHNFTNLRWVRVLWHQLVVDPWAAPGIRAGAPDVTLA